MARYRPQTEWGWLRSRIESSLSGQPGFGDKVRVEGRLQPNHDGNCHDNYYFTANGRDLILRMTKQYRSLRRRGSSFLAKLKLSDGWPTAASPIPRRR
jgi:hypothetical protein